MNTPRHSMGSGKRTVSVYVLGAVLLSTLTGCVLLEGPSPEQPERHTPPVPESAPVYVEGGSATDNLPIFTETLRRYAESDREVLGEPIVGALADAGFDRELMQISFDQTETGLVADSIFVSVLIDQECLVGQVVPDGRDFAVDHVEAVGPERAICLIGQTREITW